MLVSFAIHTFSKLFHPVEACANSGAVSLDAEARKQIRSHFTRIEAARLFWACPF
jgi:hypothetical protein